MGNTKEQLGFPVQSQKKIPLQSDILIFHLHCVCFLVPEITIQVDNTTAVTSQSIYVEWKV